MSGLQATGHEFPSVLLLFTGYPLWTFIAAVFALPFILTYIFSSIRFTRMRNAKHGSKYPPLIPYWIPFLGHTIPFVFDTPGFMTSLAAKYKSPVKIYVGGRYLNFIPHGHSITTLHKKSRQVTNVLIAEKFMTDTGLSAADHQRGNISERSGVLATPNAGWEHLADSQRWNLVEHRDFATHLGGTAQAVLAEKFADRFASDMVSWAKTASEATSTSTNSDDWIPVPDLADLLRHHLFTAATTALYGTALLEVAPTLPDDFWALLTHLPRLFRRWPAWLVPGAGAARRRVLAALQAWEEVKARDVASRRGTWDIGADEWDAVHGAKLTRARTKMYRDFGISGEGAALFHFAMMFALNPNAVSATIWAVLDVIRDADLTARIRAETAPCFHEGSFDVDVARLSALPLLGSVYMETLRLRAASPVGRTPNDDGFTIDEWRFEVDTHILSTSWLGGQDASFWNQGEPLPDGQPRHPVGSFWAERFLQYRGDPFGGPLRRPAAGHVAAGPPNKNKQDVSSNSSSSKASSNSSPPRRTANDDGDATLVTSGIAGHWYPFGGGLNTCPGRFFAKKEVMLGVAIMLRAFDFEGLDARRAAPDMNNFPFGVLPPKGPISVRMRLRSMVK